LGNAEIIFPTESIYISIVIPEEIVPTYVFPLIKTFAE